MTMTEKASEKAGAIKAAHASRLAEIAEAYRQGWDGASILQDRLTAGFESLRFLAAVQESDPDRYDRAAALGVLAETVTQATNGAVNSPGEAIAVYVLWRFGTSGKAEEVFTSESLTESPTLDRKAHPCLSYNAIRAIQYPGTILDAAGAKARFSVLERDRDASAESYAIAPGCQTLFDAVFAGAASGKMGGPAIKARIIADAPAIISGRAPRSQDPKTVEREEERRQERERESRRRKVRTMANALRDAVSEAGGSVVPSLMETGTVKRSDLVSTLATNPMSGDELGALFLHSGTRAAALEAVARAMTPKDVKPFLDAVPDSVLAAIVQALNSASTVKASAAA